MSRNYKREEKEYFSSVESLMIGLVSSIANITLKKPRENKDETHSIIPIKIIQFMNGSNDSDFEFETMVEKRLNARMDDDLVAGVDRETALRRKAYERIPEIITLLTDTLGENGMKYKCIIREEKKKAFKIERIVSIEFSGITFTYDGIIQIGKQIHEIIMKRFAGGDREMIIKMKDDEIKNILGLK